MSETLSVKVAIANRNYPLRVTQQEQEKVLAAAQAINARIKAFEDTYAVKDKQDLLAMVALQLVNEQVAVKPEESANQTNEIIDQLGYLKLVIEEYIAAQ
ncbi:MAG: hypothetical protein RIQ89_511 [Bacteroidota bacterium]|jgi:cell division protein ZapA